MGNKRHRSQENQADPLAGVQVAGTEGPDEIRKFRYQSLESQTQGERGQHQAVSQMIHAENGSFHIPHSYGVKEL